MVLRGGVDLRPEVRTECDRPLVRVLCCGEKSRGLRTRAPRRIPRGRGAAPGAPPPAAAPAPLGRRWRLSRGDQRLEVASEAEAGGSARMSLRGRGRPAARLGLEPQVRGGAGKGGWGRAARGLRIRFPGGTPGRVGRGGDSRGFEAAGPSFCLDLPTWSPDRLR